MVAAAARVLLDFAIMATSFKIALISDVFYESDAAERLLQRLSEAKARGAEIAVLPEIPLNPWAPATKNQRADDAEPPGGPRATLQSDAARKMGIGLVGGAIIRDPQTGVRRNTSLVFDKSGTLLGTFAKLHIPREPGFWESDHYDAGVEPARPIHGLPAPIGVQICSDANRPEGTHLLAAMGAEIVVVPRSTEQKTYDRWRTVFRANALTSCCFVASVNRPRPEQDVLIGGPSVAFAPNGELLLETTDPVGITTIDRAIVAKARTDYPGYLPVRADLYAKAWRETPPRGYDGVEVKGDSYAI